MTVLMTSLMPGTTDEGYHHLAEALLPSLTSCPGFIAHAAGPVDGGYVVSELWESAEAHQAWFDAHVAPTMPSDTPAPEVSYRPIVNLAYARR